MPGPPGREYAPGGPFSSRRFSVPTRPRPPEQLVDDLVQAVPALGDGLEEREDGDVQARRTERWGGLGARSKQKAAGLLRRIFADLADDDTIPASPAVVLKRRSRTAGPTRGEEGGRWRPQPRLGPFRSSPRLTAPAGGEGCRRVRLAGDREGKGKRGPGRPRPGRPGGVGGPREGSEGGARWGTAARSMALAAEAAVLVRGEHHPSGPGRASPRNGSEPEQELLRL